MRDLAVLFLHLLATVARLAGPGGEDSTPIDPPRQRDECDAGRVIDGVEYHDLGAGHFEARDKEHLAKRLIQRLRDLGLAVAVKAA